MKSIKFFILIELRSCFIFHIKVPDVFIPLFFLFAKLSLYKYNDK